MWKEYETPQSLDEALSLLARHEGRARVIAGGTDLALQAAAGELELTCAVDLTCIPALAAIALDGAEIVIGACATHAQVAADEAQPRSGILRGTREYRREMVQVLVRRVLSEAAGLDQA